MSEAITKACPAYCECGRRVVYDGDMPIDKGPCNTCKGTGRVPDVEATLRAEVARLTECNEAFGAALKATAGDVVRFADENARITAEVTRLTAEVERLSSQLKSAEEVVVQARQLGAYSWEDRLDDSRVSDDAKQDARELGISVWHYDQLTARLAGCES